MIDLNSRLTRGDIPDVTDEFPAFLAGHMLTMILLEMGDELGIDS